MALQDDLALVTVFGAFTYEIGQVGIDACATHIVVSSLCGDLVVYSYPRLQVELEMSDALTFALTPACESLLYVSGSQDVCMIELGGERTLRVLRQLPSPTHRIAVSPDSCFLAWVLRSSDRLEVLSLTEGAGASVALGAPATQVCWGGPSGELAVGTLDGRVTVFRTQLSDHELNVTHLFSVPCSDAVAANEASWVSHAFALEYDAKRKCFAFAAGENSLAFCDLHGRLSRTTVGGIAGLWGLQSIATSRGSVCAVAGGNSVARFPPGGSTVENAEVHTNTVWALAASRDTGLLVSGGDDGQVAVWQ